MKNKLRYIAPKIKTTKIKVDLFLSSSRLYDSLDSLMRETAPLGENCYVAQGSPCNSGRYI